MPNLVVDKNDKSLYLLNLTFLKILKMNFSVLNALTLLYNSLGTEIQVLSIKNEKIEHAKSFKSVDWRQKMSA